MGDLYFHGADMADLAHEFGTPLYVMSEDEIRSRIRRIKRAFDDKYERCLTHFASKSFITRDMLRIVKDEGIGIDVVSGGEIYLARREGIDASLAAFHGNSKSQCEIEAALEWGVGEFVADSECEIERVSSAASRMGRSADIVIRLCPETESSTHEYIATAGSGTKFGIPRVSAARAVRTCMELPNVSLKGFHFHAGSQLMDPTSHFAALDSVLRAIDHIRDETGYEPRSLDLGGGFGVVYTEEDSPAPIEEFIVPMVERASAHFASRGMMRPDLSIEPGRWVVAEAGITLYTVCSVKEAPDGRVWVGVDGGYPDNPRPEMYGAKYRAAIVGRDGDAPDVLCSIAGKCCESGDVVIKEIMLPRPRTGDIIAVFTTGAYCYTMANNYNMTPHAALVMVRDGEPRLSVRRQTFEELFSRQL